MTYRLRYIPGTHTGDHFPHIRYPWRTRPPYADRERAELVRQSMPDPEKFEIVEED
jgi:hypothetical protein